MLEYFSFPPPFLHLTSRKPCSCILLCITGTCISGSSPSSLKLEQLSSVGIPSSMQWHFQIVFSTSVLSYTVVCQVASPSCMFIPSTFVSPWPKYLRKAKGGDYLFGLMVSEMAIYPGREDIVVSTHHDNQETERSIQNLKTQCWLPSSSNLLYPYRQGYLIMHESTIKCLAQGPQDLTGNALTDSCGGGAWLGGWVFAVQFWGLDIQRGQVVPNPIK